MALNTDITFEGKLTCAFKNDMKNYRKCSPEHIWKSKFEVWWDPFIQSKNCSSFKFTRGVLCHGNEEWYQIWTGIDLSVQNWHEAFDKFCPEHSKISKICTLTDCFWPKYIMFALKKYKGVMLVALKTDANFERKLTSAF